MKTGFLLTAPVLLVFTTGGMGNEESDDLRRLSGTWSAIMVEANGREATPQERGMLKMKVVIQGNSYTIYFDDEQIRGSIRVDPSKKPAAIDVIPMDGPHKGKAQPGIYAFQGPDLWMVFAAPGEPRPAGFRTRSGTTESMIFYQREK